MAVTSFCPAALACCARTLPDCIVIATIMAPNRSRNRRDFSISFTMSPFFEPDPLFREDRICTAWRIGDQFLARHTARPALGYGMRR